MNELLMLFNNVSAPLLQPLPASFSGTCQVSVLRLDLLHPHIHGNKWFKLKYNLQQAQVEGKTTLLTFGGAYSNHLRATAAAGHYFGFHTIGYVRGEPTASLNPVLQFACQMGMELRYLSRNDYRSIHQQQDMLAWLQVRFPNECFDDCYILPEGGSNALAIKGCAEIWQYVSENFDYALCACGTGCTLAGLVLGNPDVKVLGVSVLKGNFLTATVQQLLTEVPPPRVGHWEVIEDYHFGGYARTTPALNNFIRDFMSRYHIPLEPVYTGKLFYALTDLLCKKYFADGSRLLILHTGGIY
ncbi:MAG: pyridoxal-phosphate dependent enzyme [Cytophagales bacterium]|nr:pyridoxal-phosphate dependent enzyme [Bernardetiaceae bacterium]MDW8204347.1 pyridoxal-phosphate dependent enzyme [Cytophagales bacterium]